MKNLQVDFESYIQDNIETHFSLLKISSDIFDVINQIKKRIKKGGKILFCGNGGSAADAQHLAAEYLVRLRPRRKQKSFTCYFFSSRYIYFNCLWK